MSIHTSHYARTVKAKGAVPQWTVECRGGFRRGVAIYDSCDFGKGASYNSLEAARDAAIAHMLFTHTTGGRLPERMGATTKPKPYTAPGCRACYWINWLQRHGNTPNPAE